MRLLRPVSLLVVAASFACGGEDAGSGADYGYMPDELPSGEQCDTGGSSGSTDGCATGTAGPPPDGSAGSACERSSQCNEGLVCSAPFDGERGELACVGACIEAMDEARWCADASACCDPNATCTARGYCVVEGTTTAATGGSTSSDTSTETSSGSTTTTTTG